MGLLQNLLFTGLLVAGLAACNDLTASETADSGIRGQAWMVAPCGNVPTVPVEPCPDQPLAASFDVLDEEGRKVATFSTGEAGYFELTLPPGSYTIVLAQGEGDPAASSLPAKMEPQSVRVEPGVVAEVSIRITVLVP